MDKKWVLRKRTSRDVLTQLLFNRNITEAHEMSAFLDPDYEKHIHDPFLFDDMKRAVLRIYTAIWNNELIGIYGDYDVDGVCATTILFETIQMLGGNLRIHMNHRENDGYGLQEKAIRELVAENITLLITNDCGISNKKEVACAQENSMDVIITDHHHPPKEKDLPEAFAIIHPHVRANKYPFKNLAGVGSAFKLVQGLLRAEFDQRIIVHREARTDATGAKIHLGHFEKWLLDAVSIATVADCMPLIGENRTLVQYGLKVLNKTKRKGLKFLLENSKYFSSGPVNTKTIGFFIGPRINAASRMEHGKLAFQLLIETDAEKASSLAQHLEMRNTERQKLSDHVYKEAQGQLKEKHLAGKKILIGMSDSWPLGVLGLVAGKISELYDKKPVILLTSAHPGHTAGTARSGNGFHIAQSFEIHNNFFVRFGGHGAAGGFALKDSVTFDDFVAQFEAYTESFAAHSFSLPELPIECTMDFSEMSWNLASVIEKFEPYGISNAKPCFLLQNVMVEKVDSVGTHKKHLRLVLEQSSLKKRAIGFGFGNWKDKILPGDHLDLVCELEKNSWNGIDELQLKILDMAPAGEKILTYATT